MQMDDETQARVEAWAREFSEHVTASNVSAFQQMAVPLRDTIDAIIAISQSFAAAHRQYGNLDRPPRRSRVAWSKRKRKRARRRSA